MRLSSEQLATIKQETEHFFGTQAEVWLFGSHVDDATKGGVWICMCARAWAMPMVL